MTEYHADRVYLDGVKKVLENGVERTDRTGVGTIGVFGGQEVYDLTKGFPLLTTKRVYTRGVFGELLFFLTGKTNNQWLRERNVNIWNEWEGEDGDLGPIYGYQWRHFDAPYVSQEDRDTGVVVEGGTDQILEVLQSLKNDPFSRRHIVSAWNPNQLGEMALPPCHMMFQFYVTPDENGEPYGLSCHLYQRSQDKALGEPFNIASYAALTQLFAELLGLVPLEFIHSKGDNHIYSNHIEGLTEQLSRIEDLRPMPTLKINHPVPVEEVDLTDPALFEAYDVDDFIVEGYDPHPGIKMQVAV